MIDDHVVHVVAMDLADMPAEVVSCDVLDAAEYRRAEALAFDRDRRRFLMAHVLVRHVLGKFLDVGPSQLRFLATSAGKPYLADPDPDLRFSVSHSGEVVLLAVAVGREVGVDVEQLRPSPEMGQMARLFAPREQEALTAVPVTERARACLECWTRKESFLKALGVGLAFPLNGFAVSLKPGRRRLLECPAAPRELDRWVMTELAVGPEAVAALTVEGENWAIQRWRGVWRALDGFELQKSGAPAPVTGR